MPITAFVQNLKPFLDKEARLDPHIAEEYLYNGALDLTYIQRVLEARTTQPKFNSLVNSELGTVKFNSDKLECTITRDEFYAQYEFGKYADVRGWVGHVYRTTGKLLTKDKLYEFILS